MSATPGRVEAGAHPPGGLAYEERGRGPAVLLVHGTALGAGVWRETRTALPDTVRALAYDRRGYGASGAPEPYGGTTVEEQAEDAAALLRALDAAPAVVCGFELGALVALDLLRRHAGLVAGAVLVEPPLLSLSAEGPEAVGTLREAIEAGAREGRAIEALLEALGGLGALARLGTDRVADARAAPRAAAADLAAGPGWGFVRRELRALPGPVAVVAGRRSAAVRREVAGALARMLRLDVVEAEAGHLVPVEAPEVVAGTILALVGPGAAGGRADGVRA